MKAIFYWMLFVLCAMTALISYSSYVQIKQNETIIDNQIEIMSMVFGLQTIIEEEQMGLIEGVLLTSRNFKSEDFFPKAKGISKRFVYKRKIAARRKDYQIQHTTYRPRSR